MAKLHTFLLVHNYKLFESVAQNKPFLSATLQNVASELHWASLELCFCAKIKLFGQAQHQLFWFKKREKCIQGKPVHTSCKTWCWQIFSVPFQKCITQTFWRCFPDSWPLLMYRSGQVGVPDKQKKSSHYWLRNCCRKSLQPNSKTERDKGYWMSKDQTVFKS